MAETYFRSKPTLDWNPNDTFESGHDFISQISDQKGKIAGKEGEYAAQQGNVGNARQTYEDAYKNQTNYGDLYNQAKGTEGVDAAKAQYQKTLNAVNATQSAMNNLPSTINAGSNVVLNSNQRNAALGNQMAKYQNTLDYQTRQNAGDRESWQTALGAAQNLAGRNMQDQQYRVDKALQDKQIELDQANQLYNQLIQERQVMRQIYGDMYEDEYRHMQHELEAWARNLDAETERYKADAQKYAADAGLRVQDFIMKNDPQYQMANKNYKNWDFGNGYSVQETPYGQAAYYHNGNVIDPAEFIAATSGNGAQWDKWNDIWGNNVSTQGVGSDTIQGIYDLAKNLGNVSPSAVLGNLKNAGKYTYLRG